jgi:hypothetical protein
MRKTLIVILSIIFITVKAEERSPIKIKSKALTTFPCLHKSPITTAHANSLNAWQGGFRIQENDNDNTKAAQKVSTNATVRNEIQSERQFADNAAVSTQTANKQLGDLPMGYETPWTARVLFNSEGGYNYKNNNVENPIHGWEKLYEAQDGDVYTITMPTKAKTKENARVQFKSPITLDLTHKYRLRVTIISDRNISSASISASENEDDTNLLVSSDFNLVANKPYYYNKSNLSGVSINDLKLEFNFPTTEDNAVIKIQETSFYDETAMKELWIGTSYYNWCFYVNPDTGSRIKDMEIEGRIETQSWTAPDFDDSHWQEALMPIGNWDYMPEVQTEWPGGDNTNYWIRRNFTLDEVNASTRYTLSVCHDDSYIVYVNGHILDTSQGWTSGKEAVSIDVPSRYLKVGKNVIATYIQQNWGGKFYDCGMSITPDYYDIGDIGGDPTHLEINEVQVGNIDQYIDYSYNYGSWVEIYNKTDKSIALDFLYISDDPNNLKKFMLPNGFGIIPAKGYKNIYFGNNSADGVYGDKAYKQVNFKLDTSGGKILLSDYDGNLISQVTYPAAVARCSYARQNDTGDVWGMTSDVTPEASNSSCILSTERLYAPMVDTDSKLFTSPFSVNVTIPEGTTLRYTTDGSTPTMRNGKSSNDGKFYISETTTLRFCLFQQGKLPSQVITRSYIYKDKDYYLPVIAISTAPDNLYNDTIGIYVDGANGVEGRNHGKSNINMDWERPVNFEYITPDGKMALNMEAEFTISGGWSRHFPPSSFKIKATKMYENKTSLDYPFFPYRQYNKYKQILIRNGGNDNDNQMHGRVRDAITQETLISSGFYVDAQDYQPVHVFFNGAYIGQLNLREPSNRYNGTANYGYDNDNMDSFEYSNGYFQKSGTRDAFEQWVNISHNADDETVYEDMRNNIVDMDEFINYWAAVTYIGCSDWICNDNNLKGYRSRDNGKFHIVLFDQDWGWANNNAIALINGNTRNEILSIYNNMTKNADFRRQLIDAYCIVGGSVFTPERCKAIGDSICRLVEPALAWEGKQPWTSFNEQFYAMTSEESHNARIKALRDVFKLGTGMNISFDSNIPYASFLINKQPVPLNKFNGTLFAPVDLEVSAPAGYNFVGWEKTGFSKKSLISKGDTWKYWDQGSLDGTNWKRGSTIGWSTGNAPLGYGNHNFETIISFGDDSTNKNPTYYFRRDITLNSKPAEDAKIIVNWVADDGFVLYVNGTEVYRDLMPEGTPSYSTYASTHAVDNPNTGSFTINPAMFVNGINTIAVEVHNNSPVSSDIYWDAEIYEESAPRAEILSADRAIRLTEDENMTLKAVFEPIDEACLIAAGSTPVVINEVSAGNSIFINDYTKKNDWIELYNTTDNDIDVTGMYLSDDITMPEKYKITADGTSAATIIPAHGYLIIWADKLNPITQLHSSFKLKNDDQEHVILTSSDKTWADTLTYMAHTGEESVGRYPDGGKRIYKMSKPTIKSSNMINTYAQLIAGEDNNFDEETYLTGVSKHTATGKEIKTEYFTADGIKLNSPLRGINIVRKTFSDGTVKTRRIIIR